MLAVAFEDLVLLDADLAILGASEDRYARYARDIRAEYAWVPDADYRAGRSRVLQHFLALPRIYFTDVMFEEGEQRARANLRFHYHYVTAREMYNLAKAAEAGYQGPVAGALDFLFVSNVVQ